MAPAAEEEDAGLLAWARSVTVAWLVVMRGMMCGRQSGAYVVFGGQQEQQEGSRSTLAKVLGPRLQLFSDTNDLLVRTLFSKSDLAPATSSFQQVGGHAGAFKASKAEDGRTNSIAKTKDACEHAFYEHVTQATQHGHPTHAWPARFMPAYYGDSQHDGCGFINIENLLDGYTRPCIMDLKMGVRTAETTAPLKKRVRMKAADLLTSCHSDGVQLIAMSVYQRSQHKQLKSSKNASALFSGAFNMEQVMGFFLSGGGKRINHHLLNAYLSQLRELLVGLEANRTYSFIGSSLLFIHDGTGLKRQRRPRIRMIDFAHVHTAEEDTPAPADPGYVIGLRTLIRALEVVQRAKELKSDDMEGGLRTVMLANKWRRSMGSGNRAASAQVPDAQRADARADNPQLEEEHAQLDA